MNGPGTFHCFRCGHEENADPVSIGLIARWHHCPNAECPDCWHRFKYHGPPGSGGCGAPGCRCTEPDNWEVSA